MNAEVSSSPTSPSSVVVDGESGFANNADNPLQRSSCLLQCEEGKRDVGREAVASSDSVAHVGASSALQSIGNAIKVGLLGRSGNRGVEDRKSFEAESFKVQSKEVPEDQQSDQSDGDRKEEGGDEDDEKQRARLM